MIWKVLVTGTWPHTYGNRIAGRWGGSIEPAGLFFQGDLFKMKGGGRENDIRDREVQVAPVDSSY